MTTNFKNGRMPENSFSIRSNPSNHTPNKYMKIEKTTPSSLRFFQTKVNIIFFCTINVYNILF